MTATILVATLTISGAAAAANLEIEFDAADFPDKDTQPIKPSNNQYWPLMPETVFVYAAETEDGCEVNKVTVTSGIKDDFDAPYDSIAALEVDDLEWLSEECDDDFVLMEKTTDWYARDKHGNIWRMGEDTLAYDDEEDCLTDEGGWEPGVDDAEAGIVMLSTRRKASLTSRNTWRTKRRTWARS